MAPYLNYDYPIVSAPSKFEELCKDLWAEEWKNGNVALHGRKGQTQLGVDVYGIDKSINPDNKKYSGIQSKKKAGNLFKKQNLTETELTKEVADAQKFDDGELEQLIIATTLDDDVKFQVLERKLTKSSKFDVRIVGWQTISKFLSKYPDVARNYYDLPPAMDDPQYQIYKTVAISSVNKQLNQAKELIDEGNPESALKILLKLEGDGISGLSKDDQFKLFTNAAVAYSLSGESEDKVIEYFERAYALGIEKPAAYHNMAAVFIYRGQLDKASKVVDDGLRKHPSSSSLKALKAKIAFQQDKDIEKILGIYGKDAKKDPELAYQLAILAADAGKRDLAIGILDDHLEKAMTGKEFEDIQILALYGSLLVERITTKNNYLLGHFDDSDAQDVKDGKGVLDKAALVVAGKQIEKLFSDIFTKRSVLNQILGDKIGAIADAKKAFDLTPINPQVAGHYAMILMEEGKFDEAHKALEIDDPDALRLKLLDAVIYQRQGDKQQHLDSLQVVIDDQVKLSNQDRLISFCAYIQALLGYKEVKKAKIILDQFEKLFGVTAESLEFRAVIAAKEGDELLALDNLVKAAAAINQDTLRETVAGIGSRLHDHKKHTEAIKAFEQMVTVNTYDIYLQQYLISLWNEREFERVEQLCKEVIARHGNKAVCVDILFNIYIEKNDVQKCLEILESISGDLTADEYSIKLARLYAYTNNEEKVREVVDGLDISSLEDDDLLGAAQVLAAIDQASRAVESLYPAILKSPNNPQLQMAYITLLLTAGVDIDPPKTVNDDSTVEIELLDSELHRMVTIENDKKLEDLSHNHYYKEHAAAKAILGKKPNDEVQLGQEDKYKIKTIQSKYIFLLHDLMNNFSERFPDIDFLQKVKIIDDKGELDLTKMTEILNQTAEHGHMIIDLYEKGNFPLASVSKISKKSIFEVFYAFLYDTERTLPSSTIGDLTVEELPTTVILDLTSCITLFESGVSIPSIKGVKVVSLSSSLSPIEEKIKELEAPKTKDGYAVAYTDKGKLRLQEHSKEVVDKNKRILKDLIKWINNNTVVIPLTKADAIPKVHFDKLNGVLNREGLDVMIEAEAHKGKVLVVSVDLAFRRLMGAELPDVKSINTQQLVRYLRDKGELTNEEYLNHIKFLLKNGFKHTFILVDDLIEVLKANNLAPNDDFRVLLSAINDERTDIKAVIGVAARFLYEYWKIPGSQLHWATTLPATLEALKKGPDYDQNSPLLEAVIMRVFNMLPYVATEIIQTKKVMDSSTT